MNSAGGRIDLDRMWHGPYYQLVLTPGRPLLYLTAMSLPLG